MASVEKMLIKGIRSFSPDNQNVVDFHKPLTLIVGQNGAGKTTIIECLRMACSGSLPPNTRSGQSFIHDPKVANDTEVKGQIRLRIRGNNCQPVVIIRSFQLTQKKSTLQFKALDQVLQTINRETGEKQALTYKCADIDRIIPTIMGVSKAILENVIFVHQEDANWPLADPKTLKERFDDVFAATKYTKALEAIRKLRNEKVQEARELKLKLDHLKTHKVTAHRLSSEIDQSKEKSRQLQSQMEDVQEEITQLVSQMEPFERKLAKLGDLGNQASELKAQLKTMMSHNEEKFAKLEEGNYDEDTEQLELWVKQFDEKMDTKGLSLAKINREIQHASMNVTSLKEQYARSCQRHGKLQAEADAHAKNLSERDEFLSIVADKLGIPGPSGTAPYSSGSVTAFHVSVSQKVQNLEADLTRLKSDNRLKDEEASKEIESLAAKIQRVVEASRMRRTEQKRLDAQKSSIQTQIGQIVASNAILDDLRQQESSALEKLNANKREQEEKDYASEILATSEAINDIQGRISALRQERDRVSVASEAETHFKMKRKEKIVKEEQVSHLLETHRVRIEAMIGTGVETAKVREKADAAVEMFKEEHKTKSSDLSLSQNKASKLKGLADAAKQQLNTYQSKLSRARETLKQGLHVALGQQFGEDEDEYQNNLAQHETDTGKMVEKVSRAKASIKVMSAYVKMADRSGACPLCKRGFSHDEKENFMQTTSEEIEALPGQVSALESRLSEVQGRLGSLKVLQPVWVRFSDLRDKQIPEQQREVNAAEADLRAVENEAEDLESLCALAKHDMDSGQSFLEQVVWPLDRLHNELEQQKEELKNFENLAVTSTSTRSVNDVDRELDELDQKKADHEHTKDDILKQQNKLRDDLIVLSNQYRDCKEEVERHLHNIQRRDELKQQVNDIDRQTASLSRQISGLTLEKQPLEQQKEEVAEKRNHQRTKASETETRQENEVRGVRTTFDQLQSKMRIIEEYELASKAKELECVEKLLKDQDSRMESLGKKLEELDVQRKACEDEMRNQDELRRAIKDCLDWRRGKEEEKKVEAEVEKLESKMGEIGDQRSIVKEVKKITDKQKEHQSKYDMMRGSLDTVQQAIQRAQKELQSPQYRDVQTKYSNFEVEVKTMDMANTDLDKYHKALEKALLAFHTTKMSDINKIIKELWQKTYRGHDIDFIQIRADTEGSGRSSYNYRLVMIVGGSELEMRGRCSAGQKVLACIIVRLALAETFCLNCGILSLDEPTTNLDQANAKSLANALRSIIEARKQQENFQLIVITHDEEFAQLLGTREHAEKMWRVSKDENHNSLVTQEDIL